ncbi:MAG: hypothetical protein KGQ77_02650 [Betaproteobacteria bacterium]|nr:hypothetical protein [Betaproteobacteria bacterium]
MSIEVVGRESVAGPWLRLLGDRLAGPVRGLIRLSGGASVGTVSGPASVGSVGLKESGMQQHRFDVVEWRHHAKDSCAWAASPSQK